MRAFWCHWVKENPGIPYVSPLSIAPRQSSGPSTSTQLKLERIRNTKQIAPPIYLRQTGENQREDNPDFKQSSKDQEYDRRRCHPCGICWRVVGTLENVYV
jgi:hypothetical protein